MPHDSTQIDRAWLIDTHAHLADARFDNNLATVLDRARDQGVAQVIAIATTADDSRKTIDLSRRWTAVVPTVGIHPNHAAEAKPGDWETIAALAAQPDVVAVGETGLDRYWDDTPFSLQQEFFDRHLMLAQERDLPVIIHSRDCLGDVLAQLATLPRPVRGVLHSFTGTWDEARALLELGLHLSFSGMITFANKTLDPLRDVAARVPSDRLLVETDSPYLSPHPFRGQFNEPARVVWTATRLAEIRGVSLETLAAQTTANARRLFDLQPITSVGDHPSNPRHR
jgi:TatD DNase family protein